MLEKSYFNHFAYYKQLKGHIAYVTNCKNICIEYCRSDEQYISRTVYNTLKELCITYYRGYELCIAGAMVYTLQALTGSMYCILQE